MMPNADMLELARSVLVKNRTEKRDSTWDSDGTPTKTLSHERAAPGTAKNAADQGNTPPVPLSHALADGTAGQSKNPGTPLGTVRDSCRIR
jgi:hypothetical protein